MPAPMPQVEPGVMGRVVASTSMVVMDLMRQSRMALLPIQEAVMEEAPTGEVAAVLAVVVVQENRKRQAAAVVALTTLPAKGVQMESW